MILLSFTGFYRVLPGFTGLSLFFSGFCVVLRGFFFWSTLFLLGFTGLHPVDLLPLLLGVSVRMESDVERWDLNGDDCAL